MTTISNEKPKNDFNLNFYSYFYLHKLACLATWQSLSVNFFCFPLLDDPLEKSILLKFKKGVGRISNFNLS